jgi:hypothetical protein
MRLTVSSLKRLWGEARIDGDAITCTGPLVGLVEEMIEDYRQSYPHLSNEAFLRELYHRQGTYMALQLWDENGNRID